AGPPAWTRGDDHLIGRSGSQHIGERDVWIGVADVALRSQTSAAEHLERREQLSFGSSAGGIDLARPELERRVDDRRCDHHHVVLWMPSMAHDLFDEWAATDRLIWQH